MVLDIRKRGRSWPAGDAYVLLGATRSAKNPLISAYLPYPFARADTKHGQAVFAYVPCGRRLAATTMTKRMDSVTMEFDGPKHAGEEVRIRIDLGSSKAVFMARAVDDQTRSLPNRSLITLVCTVSSDSRVLGCSGRARTDEEGRFQVIVDRGALEEDGRVSLEMLDSDRVVEYVGTIEFQASLNEGPTELGDVVFQAPHQLAHGVVVGRNGEPLLGAWITVSAGSHGGPLLLPAASALQWPRARSRDDGSFILSGRMGATAKRLKVSLAGYLPSEVPLTQKRRVEGVRVVLLKDPKRNGGK